MNKHRRRYQRARSTRSIRKTFLLAVEGKRTEPEYFSILNSWIASAQLVCLKGTGKTAPDQILQKMESYIRKSDALDPEEAWLVLDKNGNTEADLAPLLAWARNETRNFVAVSNPKFEYWLLLHFEDGNKVRSSKDCTRRLRKYIPDYAKGVRARYINRARVEDAIKRASRRNRSNQTGLSSGNGTTVYRLVQRILDV